MAQPPFQSQAPTTSQRRTSLPLPGNNNPFMSNGMASASPATYAGVSAPSATSGARSRESMTLGMEMAWNNGRHSPDAFASLSARSG